MTPLHRIVLDLVAEHGPLTFAAFQDLALYHPEFGYYARGPERSGWTGDFITSAELDPAFGQLWARAFERVWVEAGRPDEFEIVEVGPGEGGFAAAVLDALPDELTGGLTYRLVERLPALVERQMGLLAAHDACVWCSSVHELKPDQADVVFANEVLDNLPVHLLEGARGEVVELFVGAEGPELVLTPGAPSESRLLDVIERDNVSLDDGARYEVSLEAESFARSCAGALGRGAVIFVDYGDYAPGLATRPLGTLAAYSPRGVDDLVLSSPGERDITSHANWTAISAALAGSGCHVAPTVRQSEVLRALGLADVHSDLGAEHRIAADQSRGADALRALSRRQALGALTDPGGLGGLDVLVGVRGMTALSLAQAGP